MALFDELTTVRVDQLISSLATGIAKAQFDLDLAGIKIAQLMSGVNEADRITFGSKKYSLLELGFTPSFYHFVDSVIEVRISISLTRSTEIGSSREVSDTFEREKDETTQARTATVSASYANKYQYTSEGSSLVRTKIVPVPAPALLNERILALIDEQKKAEAAAAGQGDAPPPPPPGSS